MVRSARVLVVVGTRPEAIKLAPVVVALRRQAGLRAVLVVTGQHRALVDDVFAQFQLHPDHDLGLAGSSANGDFTARAMLAVGALIGTDRADMIVVQGDTASATAAALAAFQAGVPIAHVEAGLRTGDLAAPFPEEGNRRLIAQVATLHFAPTGAARDALKREGVRAASIEVTGNTGVDAILEVDQRVRGLPRAPGLPDLPADLPMVLVTTHRRENHGAPMLRILDGVARIAEREEAAIVLPVHPNPAVSRVVRSRLGGVSGVHLVEPLSYHAFVWALRRAALVLTDSGGVQEEAPVLGTPVLVLRNSTERPEGVRAGVAAIVGTDPLLIAGTARAVLRDAAVAAWMGRPMRLYGDGRASARIATSIAKHLGVDTSVTYNIGA